MTDGLLGSDSLAKGVGLSALPELDNSVGSLHSSKFSYFLVLNITSIIYIFLIDVNERTGCNEQFDQLGRVGEEVLFG